MPGAARMFDSTSHPGVDHGPGRDEVFINCLPAARVGDKHVCLLPPTAGPHPPTTIVKGSATVLIEGTAGRAPSATRRAAAP